MSHPKSVRTRGRGVRALALLPSVLLVFGFPAPSAAADGPDVLATVVGGPAARWMGPVETTIAVENAGDAPTREPVHVTIDAGVGPGARSSATGEGWACSPFTVEGYRTARCVREAPVPAGGRAPDIRVRSFVDNTNNSATIGGSFRVRADVDAVSAPTRRRSSQVERAVVRDTASDAAVVVNPRGPARSSAPRRFTVRVDNRGLAPTGAPLRVVLSSEGEPPLASGSGWRCDRLDRTCTFPTALGPGSVAPDIDVDVPSDSQRSDLSARVVDPDRPADARDPNDAGYRNAVLMPEGDVDLAASATPTGIDRVTGGTTFVVRVRNTGDGPSTGTTAVALGRPGGSSLTGVRSNGEGWDCTRDTLRCTTGLRVAPGDELPPLTFRVSDYGFSGWSGVDVEATASTPGDTAAANDVVSARRFVAHSGGGPLDIGIDLPERPLVGASARATVRLRNASAAPVAGPVDVALSAPAGAWATGDGWTCTTDLRCRLRAAVAPGSEAPPLAVRTDVAAGRDPERLRFGASESGAGSVAAETTTGRRAGDVTIRFERLDRATPGDPAVVPVVVSTTGSVPVDGRTVVRLRTALAGAAAGDGWRCAAARDDERTCVHDGPVPAGGALPVLDWTVEAPTDATQGGEVTAEVSPPAGTDVHRGNNSAAGSVASAAVPPTRLTGSWDALEPATEERPGRVGFVVRNDTPRDAVGGVRVNQYGSWRPEPADGWRCDPGCHHPGPVPAGGALPALRGSILPDRSTDDHDELVTDLVEEHDDRRTQYQATLPAARGPRPQLSGFVIGVLGVVPGEPLKLYAIIRTDRPVPGPLTFRLLPAPGLVVERAETGPGGRCDTALRCTFEGGLRPSDELGVTISGHVRPGVSGPVRLSSRLTAAGARPSESTTTLLPVAAGADLVTTLESRPATGPGDPTELVQRVRNDGTQPVEGRIVSTSEDDGYRAVPGRSGTGWTCERYGSSCSHDGPLPAGASLPPLTRVASAVPHTARRTVRASVGSVAGDDTVSGNSFATATIAAGAPAAPHLTASLSVVGVPTRTGATTFEARVRNVGGRPTRERPEVRFASSTPADPPAPSDGPAWGCVPAERRCLLSRPLAAGEEAPPVQARRAAATDPWSPPVLPESLQVQSDPSDGPSRSPTATVAPVAASASDVVVSTSADRPAVAGTTVRHAVRVVNVGGGRTVEPVEVRVTSQSEAPLAVAGDGWTCPAAGTTCRLEAEHLGPDEQAPPLEAVVGPLDDSRTDAGIRVASSGDGDGLRGNDETSSSLAVPSDPQPSELVAGFSGLRPVPAGAVVRGRLLVAPAAAGPPTGPVAVQILGPTAAAGDGWSCSSASGSGYSAVRCERPDAPAAGGSLPPIELEAGPDAESFDGRWYATFQSPVPRDASRPAAAASPARGRPPVDLAVALRGGRALRAGETTALVAEIVNGGTRTARGTTTVELDAPGSVALRPTGSGWTCAGTRCTTDAAVDARDRLPDLRIEATARTRDVTDAAAVSATVSHDDDPAGVDDEAIATLGVGPGLVDLAPRIVPGGLLRAGEAASWVIEVPNVGAEPATSPTTVAVEAPFGGRPTGDGWSCDAGTCTTREPAGAGSSLPPLTVRADVPTDAPLEGAAITARAENADDGTSADDEATVVRGVAAADEPVPPISTSVGVAMPISSATPGDRVPVQLSIRDPRRGPGASATTEVALPDGLVFGGVPDGDPFPSVDGPRLRWEVPLPAAGGEEAWTVWARVEPGAPVGPRTVRATLSSPALAAPSASAAPFTVVVPPAPGPTGPDPNGPGPTDPVPTDPAPGTDGPGTGGPGPSTPEPTGPGPRPAPDPFAGLAALLGGLGRPPAGPAPVAVDPPPSTPPRGARVAFSGAPRPPRPRVFARNGWRVGIRATDATVVRAVLVADQATARRLGRRPGTVLATASTANRAAGTFRLRLRVARSLVPAVGRAARITGTLRLQLRGPGGPASASRRVVLRR